MVLLAGKCVGRWVDRYRLVIPSFSRSVARPVGVGTRSVLSASQCVSRVNWWIFDWLCHVTYRWIKSGHSFVRLVGRSFAPSFVRCLFSGMFIHACVCSLSV